MRPRADSVCPRAGSSSFDRTSRALLREGQLKFRDLEQRLVRQRRARSTSYARCIVLVFSNAPDPRTCLGNAMGVQYSALACAGTSSPKLCSKQILQGCLSVVSIIASRWNYQAFGIRTAITRTFNVARRMLRAVRVKKLLDRLMMMCTVSLNYLQI